MAETALTVENLGKKYRLGTSAPYHRLSEMLQAAPRAVLTAPWKRWRQRRELTAADTAPPAGQHPPAGEFWAVRDVSFEVRQGEVVGIIGRNGAGKSTLLKLLSRITEPTTGRFGVRGRVGSLLEVGTGFHPELTGRENIELSGTLLGMNRREIRRHFDEIVAFAEIDDFLDTPVKRYSSGMYVRLGFAIAAHLNPEILIVDEVLAVGDAQFQKKCLGKMNDVAASGRTVLFVSHNMAAVRSLTSRCILLNRGEMSQSGSTGAVIDSYLAMAGTSSTEVIYPPHDGSPVRLIRSRVRSDSPNSDHPVMAEEDFHLDVDIEVRRPVADLYLSLVFESGGTVVYHTGTFLNPNVRFGSEPGVVRVVVTVPGGTLNTGIYDVTPGLGHSSGIKLHLPKDNELRIEVGSSGDIGTRSPRGGALLGTISVVPQFRVVRLSPSDSPASCSGC